MKIALYPGTFDPFTYGHLDVIERAREVFDRVIVTVAKNSSKQPLFTSEERVVMIKANVAKFANVSVSAFEGLLVDFAKQNNVTAIVRGLRAITDFEYEFQMALTNRKLAQGISTVFLMPHEKYTYLNSTIVREIARLGGDVSQFVPANVKKELIKKFRARR